MNKKQIEYAKTRFARLQIVENLLTELLGLVPKLVNSEEELEHNLFYLHLVQNMTPEQYTKQTEFCQDAEIDEIIGCEQTKPETQEENIASYQFWLDKTGEKIKIQRKRILEIVWELHSMKWTPLQGLNH